MDWKSLKAHPAADQFPLMSGLDLKNLAGNIQAKGQIFPVILTSEKEPRVLDGRNRLAAYRMLESNGVTLTPWIETYRGELSPEDYVRAVNWERMHLNASQRAMLAAIMKEDPIIGGQLKAEAKARQEAAGTANVTGRENGLKSASVDANSKVSETVAAKMNVSPRQVERADAILQASKKSPAAAESVQKIKDGASTVRAEYAKLPKKARKENEDSALLQGLQTVFKALNTFESGLQQLQLDIREIPELEEDTRSRYLSSALQLQKQLNILIRKLQEGR